MREIRKSGSEGGAVQMHCPYPYRSVGALFKKRLATFLARILFGQQPQEHGSERVKLLGAIECSFPL
jgi:hypothetical protein